MVFKAILLCASALLVQDNQRLAGRDALKAYDHLAHSYLSISAQINYGYPSCGCSSGNSGNIVLSNSGGGLLITGVGPVVPSGIAVSTDLGLEGTLDVCGALPFLSAVAFEGVYPTGGSAAVSYGCGDGNVGIQNVIGDSSSSLSSINGCGCQ